MLSWTLHGERFENRGPTLEERKRDQMWGNVSQGERSPFILFSKRSNLARMSYTDVCQFRPPCVDITYIGNIASLETPDHRGTFLFSAQSFHLRENRRDSARQYFVFPSCCSYVSGGISEVTTPVPIRDGPPVRWSSHKLARPGRELRRAGAICRRRLHSRRGSPYLRRNVLLAARAAN